MQKETKDALSRLGFGIAVMFGLYWIFSIFIQPILQVQEIVITIITHVILYGVGLLLFLLIIRPKREAASLQKHKLSAGHFMLCFILQFTATMILTGLGVVSALFTDLEPVDMNALDPVMLFLLLIFNPIVEEFVFRKLFADVLRPHGDRLFIFVSAFCFSIVHGVALGLPQVAYTFILGLIWAYVYVKTNNIWCAILLHALSNLFGSVILQLLNSTGFVLLTAVYMLLTVAAGITGIVLFLTKKKRIDIEGSHKLIAFGDVKSLITSPGMIFYILLTIAAIVIKSIK